MKWFSENRIRLVSVGFVVVFLLGSAEKANADFSFGTTTVLGPPINSPADDASVTMSPDGLELYFDSGRSGYDLWLTRRSTVSEPWGEAERLWFSANTSAIDFGPNLSADGLELYFSSNRGGPFNIWIAKRATLLDTWQEPVNIGSTVSSSAGDFGPTVSADGLELFFGSDRSGQSGRADLWVAKRETVHDPWSEPTNLGAAVNSPAVDNSPIISADGLLLFFESNRSGGHGDFDIWFARRATKNDEWGPAVNLGAPVNTDLTEYLPGISLDGRLFSFVAVDHPDGLGGYDICQVPIEPIVDLNADGVVDSADMCIMVDHWGTAEPLCDIGPMPWGDGKVDVHDLTVIAEYLFEQIDDPTLVAHWTLDETEGTTALDRAGENIGYVMGDPIWHPDAGQIDGAIRLDGVDDYVIAGPVLSAADGPFSVFAWVNGGAPGQAIISEPGGPAWLSLDTLTGCLITEFPGGGHSGNPLVSQTSIDDGNWHRVGFAWDGVYAMLYVDGVVVAEDAQDGLDNAGNAFYIGTGKSMAAGTYFSGLIDDVRVYSRAVKP